MSKEILFPIFCLGLFVVFLWVLLTKDVYGFWNGVLWFLLLLSVTSGIGSTLLLLSVKE